MNDPSDPNLVTRGARRLAQRLESDEGTMAWVLARLREHTGAMDSGIAARLGFDEDLVPQLALCNRPRSDLFREDVEAIAEHFAIAPPRLAELVREVETLERFRPLPDHAHGGLLAAARERVAEDESEYDGDGADSDDGADDSDRVDQTGGPR